MSEHPAKPGRDARVDAAISHWAPRFVANGVPLADFEEVTASVTRWEDWCSAWSARAAVHEELALTALGEGYQLSAGEHFTRAAVCYHFGKFLFVNDMAQMREAHRRAVRAGVVPALPELHVELEDAEAAHDGTGSLQCRPAAANGRHGSVAERAVGFGSVLTEDEPVDLRGGRAVQRGKAGHVAGAGGVEALLIPRNGRRTLGLVLG